ncbi:MAG: ABC transporter permease [Chloroflexi bacterium]|nr:ABC transporter permease [Chloroflexota bacterium]MBU1750020.1 ABC transporter permease [Chloroflexota bacterium]
MMGQLRELFHYRELVRNLVTRDLKVRYRNSVLGFLWSLVNPLLMMAVFTVVFTVLAGDANIPNYPLFILCALLPWNFFSGSAMGSVGSIVGNSHLINKIYFPREILPLSTVLANLVNFLLALIPLFALMVLFQGPITGYLLLLPVVMAVQLAFTLGVAFFLACLNVFFRDTGVIMDVVLFAWFFLTPVFYPMQRLPQSYIFMGMAFDIQRVMYIVNPMASIIATYRSLLYYGVPPGLDFFSRTTVTALVVLVLGYLFFIRYASAFGEEV